MTWIWITVGVAVAFVAWMVAWRSRARKRRRSLTKRQPVDWNAISCTEFSGESGHTAVKIVLETIAECFNIPQSQVYPDDDINLDYTYRMFWDVIMLDDPGEHIMETIRERVERDYPPWDSRCGPRVREIIADLSRHLESCSNLSVSKKKMEGVD